MYTRFNILFWSKWMMNPKISSEEVRVLNIQRKLYSHTLLKKTEKFHLKFFFLRYPETFTEKVNYLLITAISIQ